MAFRKIEDSELVGKGNMGQPDTPGVSTSEMQRIMDEIPREIIVPAFNELSDELTAETAAASLGAQVVEGLPEETPATVQGVMEALYSASRAGESNVSEALQDHVRNTSNPHAVTAAQTGAYTKEETEAAIDAKVVQIGAADMAQAVYDPARLGVDVTVQTYTHTRSGTVHNFAGSGANGRALMTADVQAGDTFTVNGEPVTAYMGTESAADAMAGDEWNGKWVSFIATGDTLNFKGGGGRVTVSGLSAGKILKGTTVTVKQGAKTVASVSGTIPSKTAATYTPATADQTIAAGQYLSGAQTVKGDANLKAENIRSGVSVFGVSGSLTWKDLLPESMVVQNATVIDSFIGGTFTAYGDISPGNPGIQADGIYMSSGGSEQTIVFPTPIDTAVWGAIDFTFTTKPFSGSAKMRLGVGSNAVGDSGWASVLRYNNATVNNGTDRLSLANSGLQYIKVYQGYTSPTRIHKITLIKR